MEKKRTPLPEIRKQPLLNEQNFDAVPKKKTKIDTKLEKSI